MHALPTCRGPAKVAAAKAQGAAEERAAIVEWLFGLKEYGFVELGKSITRGDHITKESNDE